MNFKPELAAKVMAGEKTVTRRLMSKNPRSPWAITGCRLRRGGSYAVCPGRGKHAIGRVRVTSILPVALGHLGDEEARREGFADAREFEEGFAAINGSYDPVLWVWRIGFEVDTDERGGGSEEIR